MRAAVNFARERGAHAIEGYPITTTNVIAEELHVGTEGVFADAGVLARGWDATLASDWLAAQLSPLGWVLLVEDSGWAQDLYEERVATIARAVLVDTLRP